MRAEAPDPETTSQSLKHRGSLDTDHLQMWENGQNARQDEMRCEDLAHCTGRVGTMKRIMRDNDWSSTLLWSRTMETFGDSCKVTGNKKHISWCSHCINLTLSVWRKEGSASLSRTCSVAHTLLAAVCALNWPVDFEIYSCSLIQLVKEGNACFNIY